MDHSSAKDSAPAVWTKVGNLTHTDEVWTIEWSHDGLSLASASRDKTAIIWRSASNSPSFRIEKYLTLSGHAYPVGGLAWSLDDSVLLTSSEMFINMWNVEDGTLLRTLQNQSDKTITSLFWLPNPESNSFISCDMEGEIVVRNKEGTVEDIWAPIESRIVAMIISEDCSRLFVIGLQRAHRVSSESQASSRENSVPDSNTPVIDPAPGRRVGCWLNIFDFNTKAIIFRQELDIYCTSLKLSKDGNYLLLSGAPDALQLWDWRKEELLAKYSGHRIQYYIIKCNFGGVDDQLIASGSEDGKVYVWSRNQGNPTAAHSGHNGPVNAAVFNPKYPHLLASCSDDCTIRIWEQK